MGHLIYDLEIGAPTKNKILKQTNIYGFLQESNRTMDYLRGSSEANETYGKARPLQQRSRRWYKSGGLQLYLKLPFAVTEADEATAQPAAKRQRATWRLRNSTQGLSNVYGTIRT